MATSATQTFTVDVPADKVAFVKTFFKEMGFCFKKGKEEKKSGIERGLDDLQNGHVSKFNDSKALFDFLHE